MNKKKNREKYTAIRQAFGGRRHASASKKIAAVFIKEIFPAFSALQGVACYHSTKAEAPTDSIISFLQRKKIRVYLPRITAPGKMEFKLLKKLARLKKNSYGIYEPSAKTKKASAGDFQIIIIPGVAFDRTGTRLGAGGGYYDRFLAKLPCSIMKTGLAYSCQIARRIPFKKHDIKMDNIITEKGVIYARKKTLGKTGLQGQDNKLKG